MLLDGFVAFGGNHYYTGVAGPDLLDVADDFFIDVRSCGDSNQWCVWVEQGNGAVFQFAGREAFGMDVGDFFEFERTPRAVGKPTPRPMNIMLLERDMRCASGLMMSSALAAASSIH